MRSKRTLALALLFAPVLLSGQALPQPEPELTLAVARPAATPNKQIPSSVLLEVRLVESRFKSALTRDCASDKCFAKGCVYASHLTLDQPRSGSLPGLPVDQGPGSVIPQDYLTEARCEFSHERNVRARDVTALVQRLEKRLSHGWLRVVVTPEALEPISKSLAEATEPKVEEETPVEEVEPEPLLAPEPDALQLDGVLRDLWGALVPHTPWMVAIFLLTLAIFGVIWAGRRLGAETVEDKILAAQLAAEPAEADVVVEEAASAEAGREDEDFATQQEAMWRARIDRLESEDEDVVARLVGEWLKAGDYPTLARALFIFGDRVSNAFSSDPELAMRKIDFAEYFRDVDESALPTRAAFFRRLNQQAMASVLLSQDDVQLFRSLREEFGSSGVLDLMKAMTPRYGALLFALSSKETQREVAKLMPSDVRMSTTAHLLASTRISKDESAHLFACISAARDGEELPKTPSRTAMRDRGPAIDSAAALSMLLPHIASEQRAALFAQAVDRSGGSVPQWFEDVCFNHMITKAPEEIRNDLLLDVDIRALAAWLSLQNGNWRQSFINELSPALQNALRATTSFATRQEQLRLANRAQSDLVNALKSAYARGRLQFIDLVS